METFDNYLKDNFETIQDSLSPQMNREQVFKAGEGAGRSGSFFFFSHDRKFIIKTLTKKEKTLMLNILPQLSNHYKQNPRSLITKIFGVFTVKTDATNSVYLMLMENTLQLKSSDGLKYIFDLKGSLVDRKTKGNITSSTTLKDVNFLHASSSDPTSFVDLNDGIKKKLLQVIRKDVDFLSEQGFMDYSLLLGVETLEGLPDALTLTEIHQMPSPVGRAHLSSLIQFEDGEK